MKDENWRNRLKELREKKAYTQGTLSIMSGVSQSQITMLETGKKPFTQKVIAPLLQALDATYSDLFTDKAESRQVQYPPKTQKTIDSLIEILESGNESAMDAVIKNIETFKVVVIQAKKIAQQDEKIDKLIEKVETLAKSNSSPNTIAQPMTIVPARGAAGGWGKKR